MFSFLTSLLGLAGPLAQLGMKITDLMQARLVAQTDLEKAKIDEQIKQLTATRDVIVAAQSNPTTAKIYWWLLAIAAIGPITYIEKIFLWDKVIGSFVGCVGHTGQACGLFNTDALNDPNLWWIVIAVFSFLFLASRKR